MTIARLEYNYIKRRESETGFSLSRWVREQHKRDRRVVGASYALRQRGGEWTDEPVIAVLVESKPTVDVTPTLAAWSLPKELGFAAVDVRVTGRLTAVGCLETKMRPAPGGVSIGDGAESGTLGCLAWRGSGNAVKRYVLSNRHVIGASSAGVGGPIYQPGKADCIGAGQENVVAVLERVAPMSATGINTVDAAIGRITSDNAGGLISPSILGIGSSLKTWRRKSDIPVGLKVRKYGRTTHSTIGKVIGILASGYFNILGKTYFFEDLIETDLNVQPGDSGALVVTQTGRSAVGLLFAKGYGSAFACAIENVRAALDIEVAPAKYVKP